MVDAYSNPFAALVLCTGRSTVEVAHDHIDHFPCLGAARVYVVRPSSVLKSAIGLCSRCAWSLVADTVNPLVSTCILLMLLVTYLACTASRAAEQYQDIHAFRTKVAGSLHSIPRPVYEPENDVASL